MIAERSVGSATTARSSRSPRASSSLAAACLPEKPRNRNCLLACRSCMSRRLKAGLGLSVGSKTWVGKNSRLRERYSALSSCSARRFSSINGVTIARCVAFAVISVWPNPTIAAISVPVPTATTRFRAVPASITVDTPSADPETTTRTSNSRPVRVQKISRIGLSPRVSAPNGTHLPQVATGRDECGPYPSAHRTSTYSRP
jgi:hypothetical protein